MLLGIYVDDLIILSKSLAEINKVKQSMSERFKMQDFGEASVILGIKIQRDLTAGTLILSQAKYARSLLDRFEMKGTRGTSIPLSASVTFGKDQCPQSEEDTHVMLDAPYRQAIGSLMYLMVSTRPDLAYAIQVLSRFGSNPGIIHWKGLKKVLQYVAGTVDFGIVYRRGESTLTGYCDADFSSCVDTSRSNGGYVFLYGGGAVSWSSKRQQVVALSTCEAEYMAMNLATREGVWGIQLMEELGFGQRPITLLSDSESAINLCKNSIIGPKSKHIRRQFHYIRECIANGDINLKFVRSELQLADGLTKALSVEKFVIFREGLGLRNLEEITPKIGLA